MGKRKDNRGRVLKTGESQRKNGTYEFRWQDANGKRHSVYAPTLDELRQKEIDIQRDIMDGIDSTASEITALELLEKYTEQKHFLSQNTQDQYHYAICTLRKEPFMQRKVNSIKLSDAKGFIIKLHTDGRKYSTIQSLHAKLCPAFQMAVDDDLIRKNPFKFRLSDIVPNDTDSRKPLTPDEKKRLLDFAADYPCYDDILILLGTGLRVSELSGLTLADIDFTNRRINVNKQLLRNPKGVYRVETPKTESGIRCIPMLDDGLCEAFRRVIQNRKPPRVEMLIDGYTGFLFLDLNGKPKVARHFQYELKMLVTRYNKTHNVALPNITPHILRHTYCTEMAAKGLNLKALQFLMGHNDAATTLNTYSHSDYELAEKELKRVLKLG